MQLLHSIRINGGRDLVPWIGRPLLVASGRGILWRVALHRDLQHWFCFCLVPPADTTWSGIKRAFYRNAGTISGPVAGVSKVAEAMMSMSWWCGSTR